MNLLPGLRFIKFHNWVRSAAIDSFLNSSQNLAFSPGAICQYFFSSVGGGA